MPPISSVTRIRPAFTAAVLVLPAIASADTRIDDFDDGDLAGWVFEDQTSAQNGTASVADGMAWLATPEPVTGGLLLAHEDSFLSGSPVYRDGTLRVVLRCNQPGTTAGFFSRADVTNNAYLFFLATDELGDGLLIFNRLEGGTVTSAEATSIGFAVGETWRLSASFLGATIALKAWRDGEPEPADPQLAFTDTAFTEGGFGLFTSRLVNQDNPLQQLDTYFDDVYFAQACPGDLDGDSAVALSDLSKLLASYGASPAQLSEGDFDGNNTVDLGDLSLLLGSFGTTCP